MIFSTLTSENDNFRTACLAKHFCFNTRIFNNRRTNCHLVTIAKHHHLIQSDCLAFFSVNMFNQDFVILGYAILFSTCLHHSIHGDTLKLMLNLVSSVFTWAIGGQRTPTCLMQFAERSEIYRCPRICQAKTACLHAFQHKIGDISAKSAKS